MQRFFSLAIILMGLFKGTISGNSEESVVKAYLGPNVGENPQIIFRKGHEYDLLFPGDTLEKFFKCLCQRKSQTCTVVFGFTSATEDYDTVNHNVTGIESSPLTQESYIQTESAAYNCEYMNDAHVGRFDCNFKASANIEHTIMNSRNDDVAEVCDFRCFSLTWPLQVDLVNFGWGSAERVKSQQFCYHSNTRDKEKIQDMASFSTTQNWSTTKESFTPSTTDTRRDNKTSSLDTTEDSTDTGDTKPEDINSVGHVNTGSGNDNENNNPASTNNNNNNSTNGGTIRIQASSEKLVSFDGIRTEILIVGIALGVSLLVNGFLMILFCTSWLQGQRRSDKDADDYSSDRVRLQDTNTQPQQTTTFHADAVVNPTYGDFEMSVSSPASSAKQTEAGGMMSFEHRIMEEPHALVERDVRGAPAVGSRTVFPEDAQQHQNGFFFLNNASTLEDDDMALYSTI